MRCNALSHLGRGADGILFFQWRASRSGAEKFHSAMLPHAGTSSRVWAEVRELGHDLARLSELRGSRVHAEAAIVWDWHSFWAQDLEWMPSVELSHRERVEAYYECLWRDGVTVDFVHPEADLSGYRLVVLPASYLLTERAAENLRQYVAGGGTAVVSYFSGIVDENDAVHAGGFGAPLRDVLGLTVEEFLPLHSSRSIHLDLDGVSADTWAEDVALDGAEVVARYTDGPAAGGPAITRNTCGAGDAWYVSTRLDVESLDKVLRSVYRESGIIASAGPADLEVVRRHGAEADYVVAINHGADPALLDVDGVDLLTGERGTRHTVPAGCAAVLRVALATGGATD
jgi:beta-galactosidase